MWRGIKNIQSNEKSSIKSLGDLREDFRTSRITLTYLEECSVIPRSYRSYQEILNIFRHFNEKSFEFSTAKLFTDLLEWWEIAVKRHVTFLLQKLYRGVKSNYSNLLRIKECCSEFQGPAIKLLEKFRKDFINNEFDAGIIENFLKGRQKFCHILSVDTEHSRTTVIADLGGYKKIIYCVKTIY